MIRDPAETIAAIATPRGFGARLVIRVSGPDAWRAVGRVTNLMAIDASCEPAGPTIRAAELRIPQLSQPVPCEVYYWPPGRSYTGQSVVEIHTWCCYPLAEAVLAELRVRPAEPGEFTLRAFLSGRLDLTQAEAVLGVIEASTDDELKSALDQLAGGLGTPLQALREELLNLLAEIELGLDFAEEDLPFLSWDDLGHRVSSVRQSLEAIIDRLFRRRTSHELPTVVLVGRPNVGKSTLFNALAGDMRAIVSSIPGTTRDYLTAVCEHRGVRFQILDTAGLWQGFLPFISQDEKLRNRDEKTDTLTGDETRPNHGTARADQIAQDKAMMLAETADLRIICLDASRALEGDEERLLQRQDRTSIVILNKIDIAANYQAGHFIANALRVSGRLGTGLSELKDSIVDRLLEQQRSTADLVATTAVRCRSALFCAHEILLEAESLVASQSSEETIASALRRALDELAIIVGAVYREDVLERIFSRFCIGK
ncbi:MAG: tRNA modification GTPase [Thermogutta sp.]